MTFYQFPREHGRVSEPQTSSSPPLPRYGYARQQPSASSKVENATVLSWKILQVAESTFRRVKEAELLPAVYAGTQHSDDVRRAMSVEQ